MPTMRKYPRDLRVGSSAVQNWAPAGWPGNAVLATPDEVSYLSSSATANTASGTVSLTTDPSGWDIPIDAVINSVKCLFRYRLRSAGSRTISGGFTSTTLGVATTATQTDWTTLEVEFEEPPDSPGVPWSVDELNTFGWSIYFRAYANASGPIVDWAWGCIEVQYDTPGTDPTPASIIDALGRNTLAIKSGEQGTACLRVLDSNSQIIWPASEAFVTFEIPPSVMFLPEIELNSGSDALVEWSGDVTIDNPSSLAPTITEPDGMPKLVHLRVTKRDHLRVINLGFDHEQDAGYYNVGSAYDKEPALVSGVFGTRNLKGLRYFLAANIPDLVGKLDFGNCENLQHIECFGSGLSDFDVSGCPSLIRICLENNNFSTINLNDCLTSLKDLRAANQRTGYLYFETLPPEGVLSSLYHFCVRSQILDNAPQLDVMPAIEQYWAWDCNIYDLAAPVSTIMNSVILRNNFLPSSAVNALLIYIRDNVLTSNGQIDLRGNAPATGEGITAANAILARGGWGVQVEGL